MHKCAFDGHLEWFVCGKSYILSAGVVFLIRVGSTSRQLLTRLSAELQQYLHNALVNFGSVSGHLSYLSIGPTILTTKFN